MTVRPKNEPIKEKTENVSEKKRKKKNLEEKTEKGIELKHTYQFNYYYYFFFLTRRPLSRLGRPTGI